MRTIIFDKKAAYWSKDADCNRSFVKSGGDYLEYLFNSRGYIYLSQIYEYFGVGWNPENNNVLYLIDDGPIAFKFKATDEDSILIHIKQ